MTIRSAPAVGIEPLILTDESTVVGSYEAPDKPERGYESEAQLEAAFIAQLQAQAYEYVRFTSEAELLANLRTQLEALNDYQFSDAEWKRFLAESISTRSGGVDEIVEKTRRIQEDHVQVLIRDNGESKNIRLIDKQRIHNNRLQVTNQYVVEDGAHHNR
ncbi:MAG: Type I site-specific deoxyribonuclease, HsdR family, partial [Actinomyces urogenitalis DORA_12]